MKKSLIALAVASVVSVPAFAATSNVDIYGILNVGVFSVKSDIPGQDRSTSVTSNASRLGFKGSEDLGGGLAAIWQIESGFNADETSGTIGSRNTFVGVKGGFGTILMGKNDTPMKSLGRKVDNFGDTMADSRNLLGALATDGSSAFDLRSPNTVAYVSPNLSGLTLNAAYMADTGLAGTNGATFTSCAPNLDCKARNGYSFSGDYTNGPMMLGLGYERQNTQNSATNNNVDRSLWRLVGGYDFGGFKLGAQYERGSANAALANADRDAWGVFGNYAIGAITLKANYLKVGDYKNSNNTSAKQYTLGADYALSKRTMVYALYAKVKNDTNAGFGLGVGAGDSDSTAGSTNANPALSVLGQDPSVFGVGVKHSF